MDVAKCSESSSHQLQATQNKMFFFWPVHAAITCPLPDHPDNGRRNNDNNQFEDTISFTCDDGYALRGSRVRRCRADGTFSGTPVTCEREYTRFQTCFEYQLSWLLTNTTFGVWFQWSLWVLGKPSQDLSNSNLRELFVGVSLSLGTWGSVVQ